MLCADDEVLYEVLVFSPENGNRGRGRPRLRFYDTVKSDLKATDIFISYRTQQQFWDALKARAAERLSWRKEIVLGERN